MKKVTALTTSKETSEIEKILEGILGGAQLPAYVGEVTDNNVQHAVDFLSRFPIGTIFKVTDFDCYLLVDKNMLGELPDDPAQRQQVITWARSGYKKQINQGARSEQWPFADDRFQIHVNSWGDKWEVVTMAESTRIIASGYSERPSQLQENIRKKTIKRAKAINPASLKTVNDKMMIMKSLWKVANNDELNLENKIEQQGLFDENMIGFEQVKNA